MKKLFYFSLIASINTLWFIPSVYAIPNLIINSPNQFAQTQFTTDQLRQLAQTITVQVYADENRASGVLISGT